MGIVAKFGGFAPAAVLVATSPLLVEAARRFLVPTQAILFAVELSLIVMYFKGSVFRRHANSYLWISLLLFLFAITISLPSHQSIVLSYIGIRPFVLFMLFLALSMELCWKEGYLVRLSWHIFFWSCFITAFAAFQVILGPAHPINMFSYAGEDGLYQGMGNTYFTVSGISVFRPTSIFFHTGKFGQAIFFLFLISLFLHKERLGRQANWSVWVALAGIAVSGQRAALVSAIAMLLFVTITSGVSLKKALRVSLFVSPLVVAIVVLAPLGVLGGVMHGVSDRFMSSFSESSERFGQNSSLVAWEKSLEIGGLFGAGVGKYSLGSGSFGGDTSFMHYVGAENAWMRIVAEWGVVGVLVLFLLIGLPVLGVITRMSREGVAHVAVPATFLVIWCFTHDVIGNYMSAAFFGLYVGLVYSRSRGLRSSVEGRFGQIPGDAPKYVRAY